MRRCIILAVVVGMSTACQNQTTPATLTPVILEVTVEVPVTPSATPDCQPADGVTLEVNRTGDSSVALHASGLQPGEIPYITFSAFSTYSSMRLESGNFARGADQQGNFSFEESGLRLSEKEISAIWDIRFIHARGVECATITLP